MTNLKIAERQCNSITIIELSGNILYDDGSVEFHKILRQLSKDGKKKVLLNFSNVTYIDSSGLGELVGGYLAVRKIGGELKLLNLSEEIYKLIEITKLSKVFDIYNDEGKAIKSFEISAVHVVESNPESL